jgi:HlyD family secretion protein
MASYAVWRATKINGQYDVKSFDVKLVPQEPIEGLRPGMTAIVVK